MSEKLNKELGQRLRKAREQLGFTQEEIARKLGFNNYQTLSSIEDGSRQIKAHELSTLSKLYFKDISYFLDKKETYDEEKVLVLWRNFELDENSREQKQQEFLKYCRNYYELEKKYGLSAKSTLPKFDITINDLSYAKCEELAIMCYGIMNLGSRPACCLEKILEEKYNIKVLYLDLKFYGSAACTTGDFGSAILVNSSDVAWRRNYDIAHELFHLLTRHIFPDDSMHACDDGSSMVEKWANAFASALLLPANEISNEIEKRIVDKAISELDLIGMAREFLVSTDALLWRLVSLRYVSEQSVRAWLNAPRMKELDKKARAMDVKKAPYISERYVSLSFKAFQQGLISKSKLAEYLGVDRYEISSKLSEYGYDEGEVYDGSLAIA